MGEGTCVHQVQTNGSSCHTYCTHRGRTCHRGGATKNTCILAQNQTSAGEISLSNGCMDELDTQICVCSKKYWKWDYETFGLLETDYLKVKTAWRIRDLQALAASPSSWYPRDIGCLEDVR